MTFRRAYWAIAWCVLGVTPSLGAQGAPPRELTLDAALQMALTANPTLAAARLQRAVDLAGVDLARERPNPDGHLEINRETPRQTVTVGLPVETASKRAKRIAVGEATVASGEAELTRSTLEIRNFVRRAFYGLLAAERRLAVVEEVRGLAQRAYDAVEQRFQSGVAPRLDALQAQLALAQADNDRVDARAAVEAARAELNVLIGLSMDAVTVASGDLEIGMLPERDLATARALAENADVTVLDRRIGEEMARVALARAQQIPDATAEAAVTHSAAPDFDFGWRVGLAITLPVFTRYRAAVRVEEAIVAQLRAEREAAVAEVRADVYAAVTRAAAGREQVRRYQDEILPQAVEVERMAQDSYNLGQSGLVALLQALQVTRDVRMRSLQTAYDFQIALADLERAIGAPLP